MQLPTIFHCGPIQEDNTFSESMQARIDRAIALYKEGVARPLIFNTGSVYRTRIHKDGWEELLFIDANNHYVDTIINYLKSKGVVEEDFIPNRWADDTVAEVYYIAEKVLKPRAYHEIRVITNEYHMERCLAIYEKILGPEYKILPDVVKTRMDTNPENKAKVAKREKESLELFKSQFKEVTPGDGVAFEKALYSNHKLYAKMPEEKKVRFYN